MICNRIQELILTDYIDGQMGVRQMELVDEHLCDCPVCKEFLFHVRKDIVYPFNDALQTVPEGLCWEKIKQVIDDLRQLPVENDVPGFWERMKGIVHIPRPVFALATIVTMVMMIGPTSQFFTESPLVTFNGQEQIKYISSLIDQPVDIASNAGSDTESPIEKYFL